MPKQGRIGCWLAALAATIVVAAGWRAALDAREGSFRTSCLSNVVDLSRATLLYAEDSDGRFPDASAWTDRIQSQIPLKSTFRCPSVSEESFGYAMNSLLSKKLSKDVKDPEKTPIFYDSTSIGRNQSDPFTSLPNPPRHGGNNVGYADGHAKSFHD